MYKKSLIPFFVTVLLLSVTVFSDDIMKTCTSDNILQVNTTYYVTNLTDGRAIATLGTTKNIYCIYNCTNNDCAGSSVSSDMSSVWLVYGTGVILLVLGTILGLPFGRISGENTDVKKGFNTTMVVKYIFFFVGLFLVYLSLGMARRVGMVYGGETAVSSATDTAIIVMMITIILFLFVFVVEFIFSILKSMMESRKLKKEDEWKEREVE